MFVTSARAAGLQKLRVVAYNNSKATFENPRHSAALSIWSRHVGRYLIPLLYIFHSFCHTLYIARKERGEFFPIAHFIYTIVSPFFFNFYLDFDHLQNPFVI